MDTQIYSNWVAKATECGFTNEEQCGLALLYALRLVRRDGKHDEQDFASYWLFMSEAKFSELRSQFELDDVKPFIGLLREIPGLLGFSLPKRRTTSTGVPTTLLDDGDVDESVDESLRTLKGRHSFDVLWCQLSGSHLREEHRTPAHAYVFGSVLTHFFSQVDPTAYALITRALTEGLSPLVNCFTSKDFIRQTQAFDRFEPFQLCLSFFLPVDDFAERIWSIQRILFYEQPSGKPINTDKQYLDNNSFAAYCAPLLSEHISKNRESYLRMSASVASEYIAQGPVAEALPDKLLDAMTRVYGFTTGDIESEAKPLRLLMNVACFHTIVCFLLKNAFNRNSERPGIVGFGTAGFMWRFPQGSSLIADATRVFDIMMSWWPGLSYCLGIESVDGERKWFYIGAEVDDSDVDELFALVVTACAPRRIVLGYMSDTLRFTHNPDEAPLKAIFRSLNHGIGDVLIFHDVQRHTSNCLCLGQLLGSTDNMSVAGSRLAETVSAFESYTEPETRLKERRELVDRFGALEFWGFELNPS